MAEEVMETVETTETQDVNNDLDISDTEIDDTTENAEVEDTKKTTEQQEENTEFDPDTLEFEETEEDFVFGDYNLSKFKDNLNLSDEKVRNGFNELSKELKEQGFTQSQIEWLMQKEIDAIQNKEQNTEPTKEQVMKELKENLTIQERKDYKVVGNYLKENLKGTELEKYYKEAMANPAVFKIVHALYSKNIPGKPIETGTTKENKEVRQTGMTLEKAIQKYTEYLSEHVGDREDRKPIISNLIKDLPKEQREEFKKLFIL